MKISIVCLFFALFEGVKGNNVENSVVSIKRSPWVRRDHRKGVNETPRILKNKSTKKKTQSPTKRKSEGESPACLPDTREVCNEEGTSIYICRVYEDDFGLVEEDSCIEENQVKEYLEKEADVVCGRCSKSSMIEDLQGLLDEDVLSIFSGSSGGVEQLHAVLSYLIPGTFLISGNQTQFEVQPNRNSVEIEGTFIANSGSIPEGAVVQVFGPTGPASTSTIDPITGDFSVVLTDVPMGNFPFVLVALQPTVVGANETGSDRKLASSFTIATVRVADRYCSGQLSVKLKWDGPTSDIDLHVIEPDGTHVWFDNKNGTLGYLDVDDVEGYGPENYEAAEVEEGSYFDVYVVAFHLDQESSVTWTLVAKVFGKEAWSKTGTFTSQNEQSPMFSLTAWSDEESEVTGWEVSNRLLANARKIQVTEQAPALVAEIACWGLRLFTPWPALIDEIKFDFPSGGVFDAEIPSHETLSNKCKYTQEKSYTGEYGFSLCGTGFGFERKSEDVLTMQGCVCESTSTCPLQTIQGWLMEDIVQTQSGCFERKKDWGGSFRTPLEFDLSKIGFVKRIQKVVGEKIKILGKVSLKPSIDFQKNTLTRDGDGCEGARCRFKEKHTAYLGMGVEGAAGGGAIFKGYGGLEVTGSLSQVVSGGGSYEVDVPGEYCLYYVAKITATFKIAGVVEVLGGSRTFNGNIITATCTLELTFTTCDSGGLDFKNCNIKVFPEEKSLGGSRQRHLKQHGGANDVLTNADIVGMGLTIDDIHWNEVELECSDVGFECGSFDVASGEKDCGTCKAGFECRDTYEGGTTCQEIGANDVYSETRTATPTVTKAIKKATKATKTRRKKSKARQ